MSSLAARSFDMLTRILRSCISITFLAWRLLALGALIFIILLFCSVFLSLVQNANKKPRTQYVNFAVEKLLYSCWGWGRLGFAFPLVFPPQAKMGGQKAQVESKSETRHRPILDPIRRDGGGFKETFLLNQSAQFLSFHIRFAKWCDLYKHTTFKITNQKNDCHA